jgi:hypothetical protein
MIKPRRLRKARYDERMMEEGEEKIKRAFFFRKHERKRPVSIPEPK